MFTVTSHPAAPDKSNLPAYGRHSERRPFNRATHRFHRLVSPVARHPLAAASLALLTQRQPRARDARSRHDRLASSFSVTVGPTRGAIVTYLSMTYYYNIR
jgi:hypothetical protein